MYNILKSYHFCVDCPVFKNTAPGSNFTLARVKCPIFYFNTFKVFVLGIQIVHKICKPFKCEFRRRNIHVIFTVFILNR